MILALWLGIALATAYGCALVAPLGWLKFRGTPAVVMTSCLVLAILACPFLIPSPNPGLRAVSAVISGDLAFKIIDYFRCRDRSDRTTVFRNYYNLLVPFPVFAVVHPDHRRRLSHPEKSRPHVLCVVLGVAGVVGAVLMLRFLSSSVLIRSSFALNHVVMLLLFVVAIESLSRVLFGLEHLAGFDTLPIIRNMYLSRSVSEFWRRYNYRIHDWFYLNVFRPTGGRHTPVRSMMLVFSSADYFTS